MFRFITLCALVSACCAASIGVDSSTTSTARPTERREVVPLLRFETDKKPDGSFSFSYEGGDKTFREESGVLENAGTDEEALEVSGSYRYIDAEGREIEVHYTAGRNGFVPVGTNILSEISSLAKAAADLPNAVEKEEIVRRKARSGAKKAEEEPEMKEAAAAEAETEAKSEKLEKEEGQATA